MDEGAEGSVAEAIETLRVAGYLVVDPDGKVKARWPANRESEAHSAEVVVLGRVRLVDDEPKPVARLAVQDVSGERHAFELTPEAALDLSVKLAQFVRQTGAEPRGQGVSRNQLAAMAHPEAGNMGPVSPEILKLLMGDSTDDPGQAE